MPPVTQRLHINKSSTLQRYLGAPNLTSSVPIYTSLSPLSLRFGCARYAALGYHDLFLVHFPNFTSQLVGGARHTPLV
jgi:hypothetical protein